MNINTLFELIFIKGGNKDSMPKHTKLLMPCGSPLALTFPITVCLPSNYFHLFSGDSLVLHQEQPLNTYEQELATVPRFLHTSYANILCCVSRFPGTHRGIFFIMYILLDPHLSYLSLVHLFLPPKMSIDCLSWVLIQLNV